MRCIVCSDIEVFLSTAVILYFIGRIEIGPKIGTSDVLKLCGRNAFHIKIYLYSHKIKHLH